LMSFLALPSPRFSTCCRARTYCKSEISMCINLQNLFEKVLLIKMNLPIFTQLIFFTFVPMAIATYISDLLYRYECVIVPGFGAFITQYHSAQINAETHELFPPQKTLSFNGQLLKNDGLLANHIAEVEKIPYGAALEKIEVFVQELQG